MPQACWHARPARRGCCRAHGLKTSLTPGSRVVTDYLTDAGLMADLEALGFHNVGYGCATCNGNSGPLRARDSGKLSTATACARSLCLSGNRNFEGRIHPQIKGAYLASPPLVIAAGTGRDCDTRSGIRTAWHGPGRQSRFSWPISGPMRRKYRLLVAQYVDRRQVPQML